MSSHAEWPATACAAGPLASVFAPIIFAIIGAVIAMLSLCMGGGDGEDRREGKKITHVFYLLASIIKERRTTSARPSDAFGRHTLRWPALALRSVRKKSGHRERDGTYQPEDRHDQPRLIAIDDAAVDAGGVESDAQGPDKGHDRLLMRAGMLARQSLGRPVGPEALVSSSKKRGDGRHDESGDDREEDVMGYAFHGLPRS